MWVEPLDRLAPARAQRTRVRALSTQLAREVTADRQRRQAAAIPRLPPPMANVEGDLARAYRTPVEEAEVGDEDPDWALVKRSGRVQAVWRREVGNAPRCEPGDRGAARAYVERLEAVQDRTLHAHTLDDGTAPLTRSEAAYLRLQIQKWGRRAAGLDLRFNRFGTAPGRAKRGG